MKLQSFDFNVLYSRGDLNPPDYISRHFRAASQCDLIAESAGQYVNFVMAQKIKNQNLYSYAMILTYRLEILCWKKQPTDHSQC